MLDGLAQIGGFTTLLYVAVVILELVHACQYDEHLRQKYRGETLPKKKGFR